MAIDADALKADAEVLREGMALGFLDKKRAISWADRLIGKSEVGELPEEIYALSLGGSRPEHELLAYLTQLGGYADPILVTRRLLGVLDERYHQIPSSGAQVARGVYVLAREGLLPEEEFGSEAWHLDDFFTDAGIFEQGAGDRELRAYLTRHAVSPNV